VCEISIEYFEMPGQCVHAMLPEVFDFPSVCVLDSFFRFLCFCSKYLLVAR